MRYRVASVSDGIGAIPPSAARRLCRQFEFGSGEIFPQMRDRRCPWDQEDVGRAAKQPGKRYLHGRGTEAAGDIGQHR